MANYVLAPLNVEDARKHFPPGSVVHISNGTTTPILVDSHLVVVDFVKTETPKFLGHIYDIEVKNKKGRQQRYAVSIGSRFEISE